MVTFFHGATQDGARWVLSFEGGPTATGPDARCIVSGIVPTAVGRRKVDGLTWAQGSELRALLPHSTTSEVSDLLSAVWRMA